MNVSTLKKRIKEYIPDGMGVKKRFAVLILLTEINGELNFVFEKRSANILQPGDICFPGGRIERGETVEECVLRETYEEIGISPEKIEMIGRFDVNYGLVDTAMYSAVGIISGETFRSAKANPEEVEEIFTVPVKYFIETEPMVHRMNVIQDAEGFPYEETGIRPDYKWRRGTQEVVVYKYGGHTIWGLTGNFARTFAMKLYAEQ